MNKTVFFVGIASIILFTLLSNIIICLEIAIGVILPGIKTIGLLKEINAIKEKRIRTRNRNEIITQLEEILCYWMIFAALTGIHMFSRMLLREVPYLTYLKLLIFFLLQFPLFEIS